MTRAPGPRMRHAPRVMSDTDAPSHAVLEVLPLGFPWQTADPFLFCVHHDDAYPKGNEHMGPAASLAGRTIGQDFARKDGWSMYHGQVVPGFPQHPHRGFETVTIVRRGLIDHSDSLGATARFGRGDVQWLTAGKGIVHAEMFPLVERERDNPLELFQIWLNLPAADKMAEPHFTMLWDDAIPKPVFVDDAGARTEVAVIAGRLGDARAPSPPPRSWASREDTHVAIWTITMAPGARFTLPRAEGDPTRVLYLFAGSGITIGGRAIDGKKAIAIAPDVDVELVNGPATSELLLLQGRPIDEPVAARGPFVMNQPHEVEQAFADFRRTQFGGWPWRSDGPVHARDAARFAKHADGRVEQAPPHPVDPGAPAR